MKVLILGGDGRAHTLVWKLFNSPLVNQIYCIPGNGGTSQLATAVDLDLADVAGVARWAFDQAIDMIIPAESPLLRQGLVDEAVAFGVNVCGPPQRAALLEYSRCAAKAFMLRHKLPTTPGRPFDSPITAEKFLATQTMPVIIKADNPTLGEAVFEDRYAAIAGMHDFFAMRPIHGENAGVVVEAYVRGPRVVMSAFADGNTVVPLLPVRLYDRLDDNDSGPQAPGVGAHTGNGRYATLLTTFLDQKLLQPIGAGLAHDSLPYWGVLSIDCVIGADGPKLTAIRTAFHESEAQVVLPRFEDDLFPWVQAMLAKRLHELPPPRFTPLASVGLGLVARGHPNYFATGGAITGVEDIEAGVLLFHSATESTTTSGRGGILGFGKDTAAPALRVGGGHPLTVVATAATLAGARGRALLNAERIQFEGRTYRGSIGEREFG